LTGEQEAREREMDEKSTGRKGRKEEGKGSITPCSLGPQKT